MLHDAPPEEIMIAEDESCFMKDYFTRLAVSEPGQEDDLDSALEESSELESSTDSSTSNGTSSLSQMVAAVAAKARKEAMEGQEHMCSICLGPMASRRRDSAGTPLKAPPPAMSVATLECSHRYHRKCLLAWCRQQAPGTCPQCRELVKVRRRATSESRTPTLSRPRP